MFVYLYREMLKIIEYFNDGHGNGVIIYIYISIHWRKVKWYANGGRKRKLTLPCKWTVGGLLRKWKQDGTINRIPLPPSWV